MAVGFDAASTSADATTVSPITHTHTPVGTPRGVLIFVFHAAAANPVNAPVTYGGVTVPAVTGGAASDAAGEPLSCSSYFLGSGIPAGAQTVSVPHSGGADTKRVVCITVTAAADTAISGTPVLLQGDGTLAEQSVNSGADSAYRFAAIASGQGTIPVLGASSTSLISQAGWSGNISRSLRVIRRTSDPSVGSQAVGFSSGTTDDRAAVHLAIAESAGGGPTVRPRASVMILG